MPFVVADFVKERKANKTPLRVIWHELMDKSGTFPDLKTMTACVKAAQTIEDLLWRRNMKGNEYEKAGDDRRAITQYEANVADWCDGSHPYDRLRIIYTRLGRSEDVVRVCQAYIDHGQQDVKTKAKYAEIIRTLTQAP